VRLEPASQGFEQMPVQIVEAQTASRIWLLLQDALDLDERRLQLILELELDDSGTWISRQ
jgi:hypothetical protein